jgi:starch phosphorylase
MTPRYTPITTPLPELYQTSKLGMNTLALTEDFKRYFGIYLGQDKGCASGHYLYAAMAHTLRDRLFERMKNTKHTYADSRCKQAYYLSMEFLMGRATGNAALNLGIEEPLKKALVNLVL